MGDTAGIAVTKLAPAARATRTREKCIFGSKKDERIEIVDTRDGRRPASSHISYRTHPTLFDLQYILLKNEGCNHYGLRDNLWHLGV